MNIYLNMTLVAEEDNFASKDQISEDWRSTTNTTVSILTLGFPSCIFSLQDLPEWSPSFRQCLMSTGVAGEAPGARVGSD